MPFKIVRNDITQMNTDAIVNTANQEPIFVTGCDYAIYKAAGEQKLLEYRRENIGVVDEGEAFITPGFDLPVKYIIHAVSPLFIDGNSGEEEKLRSCYRKSLNLALEYGLKSVAFPLIATGGFGYPQEEGMLIAVEEINAFLIDHSMDIYLVVFGTRATELGYNLSAELRQYIDSNYVSARIEEEYSDSCLNNVPAAPVSSMMSAMPAMSTAPAHSRYGAPYASVAAAADKDSSGLSAKRRDTGKNRRRGGILGDLQSKYGRKSSPVEKIETKSDIESLVEETKAKSAMESPSVAGRTMSLSDSPALPFMSEDAMDFAAPICASAGYSQESSCAFDGEADDMDRFSADIRDRMKHLSDTFSEYLFYLIGQKGYKNEDVWKRALVDKKVFSKIKNNPDYHPKKITALCLCVGMQLSLDETIDLLARAGYALSPCDKTDLIFRYFIERGIYDMIELDIQLEEYGLDCIIA